MQREATSGVVLEGILVRSAWSDTGEVVELSLMTFDEREYSIDLAEVSPAGLRDLVRQRVRMWVTVRDGRIVQVTSAEPL